MIGMVFCFTMTLSAMKIYDYCEEKEAVIRTESGVFNEDYLYLGSELNFSGEAEDLVFLGKRLTFNGKTKLGLIALCEKLIFSGEAGNGIIAGGMDVVVNGTIASTSYIGCKSFNLSDKAVVNGNLFIGCAKLSIDGNLFGDLYAGAGEIVINNEIHGNVTAYGGRIIIGEKGKIIGNLKYSTKETPSEKELARVTGAVEKDENHKFDWNFPSKMRNAVFFFICLAFFISIVFVGSLLLFIPAFRKLDAQQSAKTFWNTSLWGLIPVLMYPAVVILCFAMVVTIPFAVVLLLAFFPLFYIAYIIGTTLVGKYIVKKCKWNVQKRHYQFLIGILAGFIITMIPFLNFLYMIFIFALGWGLYISFLFNKDMTVIEDNPINK